MSVLALGLLFGGVTLVVMFSGMPIAFAPGFAAGIIAAGGTLGILLPPSITMIL